MKKRHLLIILFTGIFSVPAFSQYDSIVNAFQQEFEQFKQSAIQKQQEFISQNDSVFLSFLEESWKQMDVFQGRVKAKPKPVSQPVIKEDTLSRELEYIQPQTTPLIPDFKQDTCTGKLLPLPSNSRIVLRSFDFYGQPETLAYLPTTKPAIRQVNKDEIIGFYRSLAQNSTLWDYNLDMLQQSREKYGLNDWGYFQLVKSASQSVFNNPNEQRLLCWYLLLKSGYRVKVGFDRDEVYVLIPSLQKLYNILYLAEPSQTFYLLDVTKPSINNLQTYQAEYPGSNRPFSFVLQQYPRFKGSTVSRALSFKGQSLQFTFQQKDIDFLNTYPLCDLNAFFYSGISEKNLEILDRLFQPMLSGKNEIEKVNVLLDFCQHALAYQTDQEQFGSERYLFAEESLFYPYCDCEDRSILLAALVKRYTKLTSVALDFPGHVALAVKFNNEVPGDYYIFRDEKYTVCDPTYIGARCGMLPPEFKNVKAEFVTF